ncbi:hypothetical protein K432DRAFT_355214 [Lepidopterella palustris CBS 459.81]|uniref:RNI-like protein n=1 Tax=Lepidopterella palustris CBS 459.81 TaxID=1314670 RepID=A0A8E2E887_9PEZI|nr:hypothetical protein K432DRAFT_355214 [Lepidopterella palustris CBS 459.81]
MAPALPDVILHLLCEELALQRDFDTLFACACTSRGLAIPALTNLYRSHHVSPVRGGGDDEAIPLATQKLVVQKWSILWRSIIASSLNATLFPYCRYIKTLDLRDLVHLLENDKFKGKIQEHFFSKELSRFQITTETHFRKTGKRVVLHPPSIIDAVGEVVTEHTPMLEQISGPLLSHALIRWSPRLPRLHSLELWEGKALEDELLPPSIKANCPNFDALSIYTWVADDRDHKLSEFIGGIRPQSLKYLETISNTGIGAETFLALSGHGETLKELRLCLRSDSLPHLPLLRGCTAIETLRMEDSDGVMDLEKTQNDVFLEVIAWLRECKNLRSLSLTNFVNASALVLPLLLEENIHFRKIEVDSYVASTNRAFHQALTHQRSSLRVLFLSGDGDEMFRDDVDILVDSLTELTELRELELRGVSDWLKDEHFIPILDRLKLLEDLYISGLEVTDDILEKVAGLRNLRSVTFMAMSKFTMDGLLQFISKLGPGNQGIVIMDSLADPTTLLSDDELALVRETLAMKVGGRLEYTPFKDPEVSEFEGDSD